MELIKKKSHGEVVVARPEKVGKETKAGDLMAALEASLAKARSGVKVSKRGVVGDGAASPGRRNGKGEHVAARRRKSA